jgi:hypothetical protein
VRGNVALTPQRASLLDTSLSTYCQYVSVPRTSADAMAPGHKFGGWGTHTDLSQSVPSVDAATQSRRQRSPLRGTRDRVVDDRRSVSVDRSTSIDAAVAPTTTATTTGGAAAAAAAAKGADVVQRISKLRLERDRMEVSLATKTAELQRERREVARERERCRRLAAEIVAMEERDRTFVEQMERKTEAVEVLERQLAILRTALTDESKAKVLAWDQCETAHKSLHQLTVRCDSVSGWRAR